MNPAEINTAIKKKSPKYSSYIVQALVNAGNEYLLMICNSHKLIMLLRKRFKKDSIKKLKAEDFFKIEQSSHSQDEEMKESQQE